MMDAVVAAARRHGWPPSRLHLERFRLDVAAEPFVVRLARSGRDLRVAADESLLESRRAPACRSGTCAGRESAASAAPA